jgi:formylglycine-generating enzyme
MRFWATVAVVAMACQGALAGDQGLEARRAEFALWQKANPGTQARITRLKARTAVQLKRHSIGMPDQPPKIFRIIGAISDIWDIAAAPRLSIIPAGEFTMGAPDSEAGRTKAEGPQHRVVLAHPFAVGTYLVTRDEYAAFVADTDRPDPEGCFLTYLPGQTGESKGYNWHNPGFAQSGSDPAVCISWEDARDYAAWLSTKTGERYRLLSEAEWEYAARAGTTTARPWGEDIGHADANYRDDAAEHRTSPVGSFPPNAFGLYDALGNVWQRVDDCWNADFDGAPADGSVWRSGDCSQRTGHGGAFDAPATYVRSAFRGKVPVAMHYADGGFRIAREL